MVSPPRRGSRAPRAAPPRDRSAFARVCPPPEAPASTILPPAGTPGPAGRIAPLDTTAAIAHLDTTATSSYTRGAGKSTHAAPPRKITSTTTRALLRSVHDDPHGHLEENRRSGLTTRRPLGLGYKGALPGSCTHSTPTNSTQQQQARVSRANKRKINKQAGKKTGVSQRSRARRRDERRGVAREARARRPSRPDASARAVLEKRHRRRAVAARVAVVAAARGDSRRGGGDERGAAALPSSIGGGDVDELLITCRPRRHLVS